MVDKFMGSGKKTRKNTTNTGSDERRRNFSERVRKILRREKRVTSKLINCFPQSTIGKIKIKLTLWTKIKELIKTRLKD